MVGVTGAFALGLVACAGGEDGPVIGGAGGGETLDPGTELVRELVLEPSADVATVATVTFRTDAPMVARAWLTPPGLPERALAMPLDARTDHTLLLLGAPEGERSSFRIEVEGAGERAETVPLVFDAGMLPAAFPRPVGSGPDSGFVLVPVMDVDHRGAVLVLDPLGRVVWARSYDAQGHRARLLPDGSGVAVLHASDEVGGVEALGFDGALRWRAEAERLHQDFDLVDADTALVLGWESVETETEEGPLDLRTDVVVELSADGTTEVVWSLLDDVDYRARSDQQQRAGGLDWAHTNYLELADDGRLYLTALTLDAALVVDPDAGALVRAVGLDDGGLDDGGPPDAGPLLDGPHSAWPDGDELVVFRHFGEEGCSDVVRVRSEGGEDDVQPLFDDGDCMQINYLGNAQPLPDGGMLVDWSHEGVLHTRDADGALVGELALPFGHTFGYAEWVPALGQP